MLDRANIFVVGYLGTQAEIAIRALNGMAEIFAEGQGIEEHQEMHGRLGRQCSGLRPAIRSPRILSINDGSLDCL